VVEADTRCTEAAVPRTAAGAQAIAGPRAAQAWLWATVALTGGAFALTAAFAPAGSAGPARGLGWILLVGSSGHIASTGWLYSLPDVREYASQRRWRFRRIPVLLAVAGAITAAALSPGDMTWLLLPFFGWQFFHFAKQNLGVAALAATTPLTRTERRVIVTSGWAGAAGLMARPGLLQLAVNPRLGWLFPAAMAAFAGAAVTGTALLALRPRGGRPSGFCVMYLMAAWFSLPVFVFTSPYAAVGGMTIAHGTQYLLLVGLIAARSRRRGLSMAALCNVVLLGGAALSVTSHLHGAGPAGRLLFGAYLGAVMAHFVVDAGLWRLRDPFPRAFMRRHLPYLVSSAGQSMPDPGRPS
jgi:hypothetical protein